MDLAEMGQAYQFLLRHRTVESKPMGRRRMRPGESEVVGILRSADINGLEQFNAFLKPQGLQLLEYSDTDYGGISAGGRVWLLARDPEGAPPEYMSTRRIHEAIRLRDTETREVNNVWFLHIWLIYLSLIYTRAGRGVSQVSDFTDALFMEQNLIDAVREHIEKVRNIGESEGADARVIQILDAEKGTDVGRRVKGFLGLMCDSGLLLDLGEGEYQQSLLGAIEIAQGFNRSMRHYIVPEDDVLDNIVNIAAPQTEQLEAPETDDVTD